MNHTLLLVLSLVALLSAAPISLTESRDLLRCRNPNTISSLNVTQYLGLWYNIAADSLVLNTFQSQYCVTATYGLNDNGTVSVLNEEKEGSVDGPTSNITGYAYQSDPEEYPGHLKVYLDGSGTAPYWILLLGPVVNDLYSYAVISDPVCAFLWINARETTLSDEDTKYIQDYLNTVGWDMPNDWNYIYQEGCY